jgi:capsular exopolysaccharide synthesis family protein
MNQQPFNDQEGEATAEPINLRHYWHVVLERRWLVITAFVSVFVLCLIYLFKAVPVYQATVRLQIDRESESVLNLKDAFTLDGREQDYLQTQYKNLGGRTLITSVYDLLNLKQDERYNKRLDPIRRLMDDIMIAPIRLSRLVDIKVEHTDARKAALIANTLATNFMQRNLDHKLGKMTNALAFLKQEADTLERKVEEADIEVQRYREQKNMVSLEADQNIIVQGLRQAKETVDRATSRAVATQRVVQEVESLLAAGKPADTIPQVLQDKLLQDLKLKRSDAQAILQSQLKKYGNRHPDVIRTREMILSLDSSIAERTTEVLESFRNEARIALSEEETLRGELRRKEEESLKLSQLKIQYDVLSRKAQKNRELFSYVLERLKETDIVGNDKSQNIRIQDAAIIPLKPIKPRWTLTIFLGVVGGLAVAFGLAFFVNYLDDSIKSQDDVETYLKLPFLGYVPNIKTNSVVERDLQAHLHPQSSAAEGFRTVRAAIALSPQADKFQCVAVTSTIPSEGKSLVASNLAIVIAQTGLKTLLVDADLRRPSVHKSFQLQSPVGLSSYLTEKVNRVDEFIHPCDVPNLDLVCCGAVPASPAELLSSKRMTQFLQEVRQRYERIILDCPPVSAVSDPLLVGAQADGIVFVMKFNKIRREHARKSVQRVQDAGIRILGTVLNDIDFDGKDSYYYSYYYYQNRYYASHYKTEAGEKPEGVKADAEKA